MNFRLVLSLSLLAVSLLFGACHRATGDPPPEPPSTVVAAGCTLLEAVTDSGLVDSVCARADELGQIVDTIASMRASEPPDARKVARCEPIAGTKTCATNAERLAAIRSIQASRARDASP